MDHPLVGVSNARADWGRGESFRCLRESLRERFRPPSQAVKHFGFIFVGIVMSYGVYFRCSCRVSRHPVTKLRTSGIREALKIETATPVPYSRRHAGKALLCSQVEPRASPCVFWREGDAHHLSTISDVIISSLAVLTHKHAAAPPRGGLPQARKVRKSITERISPRRLITLGPMPGRWGPGDVRDAADFPDRRYCTA